VGVVHDETAGLDGAIDNRIWSATLLKASSPDSQHVMAKTVAIH
jgi:hypothetical protein